VQITTTPTGVIVKDSPGLHWLLGALFIGVGAVFVAGAFSVDEMQLLAGGAGVIAIATGVWVVGRAPWSVLVIDGDRVHLRGETFRTADIEDVRLIAGEDDEGGTVYQIRLAMRGGGEVAVSRLWVHGRAESVAAAKAIARAAGVTVVNS